MDLHSQQAGHPALIRVFVADLRHQDAIGKVLQQISMGDDMNLVPIIFQDLHLQSPSITKFTNDFRFPTRGKHHTLAAIG